MFFGTYLFSFWLRHKPVKRFLYRVPECLPGSSHLGPEGGSHTRLPGKGGWTQFRRLDRHSIILQYTYSNPFTQKSKSSQDDLEPCVPMKAICKEY